MCTAATYQTRDFYFGRTLDYEFSYGDAGDDHPARTIPLRFAMHGDALDHHYAMIGMAHVAAGLSAVLRRGERKGAVHGGAEFCRATPPMRDVIARAANNVAQFELIPYLLGQCATCGGGPRQRWRGCSLVGTPFSAQLCPPRSCTG